MSPHFSLVLIPHLCLKGVDCHYWKWAEPPATPFLKQLLLDLRDAVWNLREENNQSVVLLGQAKEQISKLRMFLEEKDGETDAAGFRQSQHRCKFFRAAVVCCVFLFLASLVANLYQ